MLRLLFEIAYPHIEFECDNLIQQILDKNEAYYHIYVLEREI